MQTVVETDEYLRRAKQCKITEEEREAIVDFLADYPTAGSEMQAPAGFGKFAFPRPEEEKAEATGSLHFIPVRGFWSF